MDRRPRRAPLIQTRAVAWLAPALARSPALRATQLATAFFLFFVALRSRDYTEVDGAVRCLEVFHRQRLFFHGNNHLLYPVDVFFWHRLLSLLGVQASSPSDYIALTQVMNAAAAAGCAAVLYRLTYLATESWRAALAAAALWSFSGAFLLHATNAAEPMVGIFWSSLAILLVALSGRRDRLWEPFAAGILMALAMASYESAILIAPLAASLCWSPRGGRVETRRATVRRLAALLAGGLAGVVTIYGLAYHAMGIPGIGAKVERFRGVSGYGVFGGLSAQHVALLPFGLATGLLGSRPRELNGFRSLLSHGSLAVSVAAASLAVVALAVLGTIRLWRSWPQLTGRERAAFACGIVGLAGTAIGPVLWDPLYDKLWLQPLGCASFLAILATTTPPPVPRRSTWRIAGALALLSIMGFNLAAALLAHRRDTPYMAAARRVSELTTERDLVVCDWDEISVLYHAIWGSSPHRHELDFPSSAASLGGRVGAALEREAKAAWQRGGQVYFLGVLEQSKPSWNAFLGNRAHVPFDILTPYRRESRIVATFPHRSASIHLFLYPAASRRSSE